MAAIIENKECGYFMMDKDGCYTISELIELLQFMKEKYGDCEVLIEDVLEKCSFGFSGAKFESMEEARKLYPEYELKDTVHIVT